MQAVFRIAAWTAAISMALLIAACGGGDRDTVNVLTIGSAEAPFQSEERLSPTARLIRGATTEGLVGFDEQGRVIPGLADRWIVTDDGQSYIFRLRDGAWRNGSQITAQSARSALRRAIASQRGTPLGLDLAVIDETRVMAERVIEIRLKRPMPNLLQLLAQPELGLAWKGEGAGPMRLARDADSAALTPVDPEELGQPAIDDWEQRVRTIVLQSRSAEEAVAQFNRGEADLLLGGRIEHFPLASSVGLTRGTIQLDPVTGLFGLAVVNDEGFLSAPENREAIAMAIDREALIAPFGLSGWAPSTRIVAPGMEGDLGTIGERWTALTIDERRAQAAARVQRWREAQRAEDGVDPSPPIQLRIALPKGPGADILFERLTADLSPVGIELLRVAQGEGADLALLDVVARYPRASWFLNQLSCQADRGLCSESADERTAEARDAVDDATRAALLAEAEAELTSANVFIPLGAPIRWSLVRGDVTGFATNAWAIHPLMPLALRTK